MNQHQHDLAVADSPIVLANARLVLGNEVVAGHVAIAGPSILSIDTGLVPRSAIDLEGDYLVPGLVDIHTDHLEKHVFPRAHVRWDMMRAVLSHDAQIIGAGVTTVFDSLCVGATLKNPERRAILDPMIEALRSAGRAGALRAEHLVHLRCEITDDETPGLVEQQIGKEIVRVVSVMEHLPGRRQSRDVNGYIERRMVESGKDRKVVEAETRDLMQRSDDTSRWVRPRVVDLAHQHGLPLMSHDDADEDHIHEARAEGVSIAEFPVSLEAARAAKAHGLTTVAGAPNVLRGGSQSGNVAVRDLLDEGLVDILASDYVPRSLLDCAFHLAAEESFELDLPAAIRTVSVEPARAGGLTDRGVIAPGLRADLLQVTMVDGHPVVRRIWRAGERVA